MDIVYTGGYLTFLGMSGHITKNSRFCRFNNKFGDLIKVTHVTWHNK